MEDRWSLGGWKAGSMWSFKAVLSRKSGGWKLWVGGWMLEVWLPCPLEP